MNIQEITDKIAQLQRAKKTATTQPLKDKLKEKIADLKDDLKNANVPISRYAQKLLGSQKRVANYTASEFKTAIKKLSRRNEYGFLKAYSTQKVIDDKQRYAKPVGWRFKGDNVKKPTPRELAVGKAKGTVYYEDRPDRSDVVRPVKLAKGGSTDLSQKEKSIIDDYKKTVVKKYNDWIAETDVRNLKKLYTNDLNDHLYLIERMERGSWEFAYKLWAGMDTASREEITNDAYKLLMDKNNFKNYAKGGSLNEHKGKSTSSKGWKVRVDLKGANDETAGFIEYETYGVGSEYVEWEIKKKYGDRVKNYSIKPIKKMAEGGMTEHGLRINDTIKSGGHIGKTSVRVHNSNSGDFRVDLDKGTRTKLNWNSKTKKYEEKMAMGGDIMPLEKYESIHDEISEHKFEKGGSVANAVDKHLKTKSICAKHGVQLDDYKKAHQQYAKGGQFGDSGIIEDANSLYNGKMGTIVGDNGNFYLVKTIKGTGLVKKTRFRIIADEYAKGGNITKELDVLWRWNGLTVNQIIEILNALNDAGITDEDLKTEWSKNGRGLRDKKAKKTVEVWKKAKPYYKGSLEGNMYYSLVEDLISKANSGETILEDWKNNPIYSGVNQDVRYQKPYNDDWRFAKGGMTKKEFVGKKVGQVMHEYKQKNLHIGTSDKIVKKRKQAVAIAINVAQQGWKHKKKK